MKQRTKERLFWWAVAGWIGWTIWKARKAIVPPTPTAETEKPVVDSQGNRIIYAYLPK